MYYTFFFNVDAVVCQNNSQFQVWELNIWQFIVIVEIKYFLNLNEYYLPIFILSIHFRQISFFKIIKDIQSTVIITITLYKYCIEYISPWTGFNFTILVVIGVDCKGSCKSKYHMITAMTTTKRFWVNYEAKKSSQWTLCAIYFI